MQTRRKGSKGHPLGKRKEKTRASLRVAARRVGRVAKTTDHYVKTISRAIEKLAGTADPAVLVTELAQASIDHFDAVLAEVWVPGLPHKAPHDGPDNGPNNGPDNGWIRQTALARRGKPPEPDPILGQHYATLTGPQASPLKQAGKQFLAWARRNGAKYILAQPLQVSNRPAGLLAIYCRKQPPPEAPGWAQIYAAMTGATLDSARALSESRKAITQLQFLVEASQVLNSTLNLGDLLDLILNLACKETNADRGSVFLVDRDRREVWTIVAHGLEEQEIRLAFGQGVAGYVAQTGQTLNIDDAYSSPHFDPSFDERFHYRTRNLLCAPIRNRTGEIVGILQLLNKREGRFAREDEEFLNTLSVHMALALENARLHRELLEKQWLERELALARRIQRGLLPDAPPVVPGFDIAVLNEPSHEVGGDYYDFLTLGPNTLLVVIADVEGKGVTSALTMSNLQATLRALVMHLHSLEVITLSLNEMILAGTHAEKFLSIFLGLVDTRRTGLHYINAGHIPPIVVRANGEVLKLEEGGTLIGLFDAAEYKRASLKLLPGDVLLCCTDGITKAQNAEKEEFGLERLVEVARAHRHLSAQQIVDKVARQVSSFAGASTHSEDKVLMVLKLLKDSSPAP